MNIHRENTITNHHPGVKMTLLVLLGIFALTSVSHVVCAAEVQGYPASLPVNQFINPVGVAIDGEIVRLIRKLQADEQGVVTLEAEEADKLLLQPGTRDLGEDKEASNGLFIHFVDHADYSFQVENPGKYQTWYRACFPSQATWVHVETMDGRQETVVDSANNQPAGKWLWLKGPSYILVAGRHSFALNNYHGGVRLDKIVFASDPQFNPSGLGPSSRSSDASQEGRIETPAFTPPGLRQWDKLVWKARPAGSVVPFYSRDLGKTWSAVPADGSLSSLTITPNAYNGIKLAFVLKASKDGATAFLQGAELHYLGAPPTALANEKIALEFSTSGELLRITNRKTGQICSSPSMRSTLITLTKLIAGNLQTLASSTITEQKLTNAGDGSELHQRYLFANGNVEAEVTIRLDRDELSHWRVKVINRGKEPIVHVNFPKVDGLRLTERGNDDWLFVSKVNGNLYRNPAHHKTLFGNSAGYPRTPAYKFITYWNKEGGLYVADLDPTFRDTGIVVDRAPEDSIGVDFQKTVYIKPGATWESGEFVVAAYQGDWHWAADRYRQWLEKQNIPDHTPRWVREEFDGWNPNGSVLYQTYGFYGLVRAFETTLPLGLTTLMSNHQAFDGNVGYCGLAPAANPTWGAEQEFAQANLAVQERGGHSFFYINWHLVDRAYSHGTRIARNARQFWPKDAPLPSAEWHDKNAVHQPDGSVIKETPFAVYEEFPLCNAATDVMKFHTDWTRYYVEKYRATGIYWDTLGDIYPPCYDLDHGHADLGQWQVGSRRALEESAAAARKIDPHHASAGEGVCSVYLHGATDLLVAVDNFTSWDIARYTSPNSILLGGRWTAPPSNAENLEDLNLQFLTAARFMGQLWDDPAAKFLRLRRAVKQLLYPARYRDTVGLSLERPAGTDPQPRKTGLVAGEFSDSGAVFPPANGIMATQLRLDRAATAVTLVNLLNTTGKSGATVEVSKQECPKTTLAWLVNQEGSFRSLPVADTGKGWKFAVPVDVQSTALLVERCEPMIELEVPPYAAQGETIPVKVQLRNLNAETISGSVRIECQDGFKVQPQNFQTLGSGETKTLVFSLAVPGTGIPKRYDFDVVAESQSPPQKLARRLFWMYVGQPLRLTIRESTTVFRGVDLIAENMTSQPVKGTVEIPSNEFIEGAKLNFDLPAHEKQTLVISLRELKLLEMRVPVMVKVRYGEIVRELVQSLTPIVSNGDFEIDLAGDGQPDDWTFFGPTGVFGIMRYDQVRLDDQIKHSGRYSLRLPPAPVDQSIMAAPLLTHGIVGHSYRVRVAIRREVAGPVSLGGPPMGNNSLVGQWEILESVMAASPRKIPGPGAQTDCQGDLGISIWNRTQGHVWVDSVTVEDMESK